MSQVVENTAVLGKRRFQYRQPHSPGPRVSWVTTLAFQRGLANKRPWWIRTPEKGGLQKGYHANRLCLHEDKVVCANIRGRMYS